MGSQPASPGGVELVPLADVSDDVLAEAWTAQYAWMHETWAPITAAAAVREAFEEEVLPTLNRTASDAAVDGGRITALTLAMNQGWDGRTFLIGETIRPDEPSGRQLLGSAIAAVLAALADAGSPLVEFEGHAVDPHIDVVTSVPAVAHDPLTVLIWSDRMDHARSS